jgi:hypothetical protein
LQVDLSIALELPIQEAHELQKTLQSDPEIFDKRPFFAPTLAPEFLRKQQNHYCCEHRDRKPHDY